MFEEEKEKAYSELRTLADAMEDAGAESGERSASDCEVVGEAAAPASNTPEANSHDPKHMASAAVALLQAVKLKMQSACFGALY